MSSTKIVIRRQKHGEREQGDHRDDSSKKHNPRFLLLLFGAVFFSFVGIFAGERALKPFWGASIASRDAAYVSVISTATKYNVAAAAGDSIIGGGGVGDDGSTQSQAQYVRSIPASSGAVIASGDDSEFPGVFYRANTSPCFRLKRKLGSKTSNKITRKWMRLPMFKGGVAAGPLINCAPSAVLGGLCDVERKYNELEAVTLLREGEALQFFLPPQDPEMYNSIVVSRVRMSSSTGIVFLDKKYVAVASYGMKKIYLYHYTLGGKDGRPSSAHLLDSVNTSGNPDLMDVDRKRQLLVVSHLKKGTQQLFKYDLASESIKVFKEVHGFGPKIEGQWCHEAAFYPSENSTVIAATSSRVTKRKTIVISLFDYMNDNMIGQYRMESNKQTRGYKAQGLRFINNEYILAGLTNLVVKKYDKKKVCQKLQPDVLSVVKNRIVLIRLNFSVDDIASGKAKPATSKNFTIVGGYDVGVGALDGLDYHNKGYAMVADQLNDRVLFFKIDPAADEPLKLASQHRGYIMPHGVAFSRNRDHVAVTSYGENSVVIQPVPASLA